MAMSMIYLRESQVKVSGAQDNDTIAPILFLCKAKEKRTLKCHQTHSEVFQELGQRIYQLRLELRKQDSISNREESIWNYHLQSANHS